MWAVCTTTLNLLKRNTISELYEGAVVKVFDSLWCKRFVVQFLVEPK